MKRQIQQNHILFLLIIGILVFILALNGIVSAAEQSIELIDISIGDTEIKQEIIGEKVVQFYLETIKGEQTESTQESEEEGTEKTIVDNTVVRISGYDVTGLSIDAKDDEQASSRNSEEAEQKNKGIFSKILSWIFG